MFQPDWESLSQYQCPDWFRDAKFGIWAHWGPNSVPEVNDPWYARNMYLEGSPAYQYHVKSYGHPSRFGYKDVIPLWKAEKRDPDRLMALYKKAGARYFTALALYCDNVDCWNSKHHKWNSVNMGPKQDIVGQWKKAADKYGLRFGVSDHGMRAWNWFNTRPDRQLPARPGRARRSMQSVSEGRKSRRGSPRCPLGRSCGSARWARFGCSASLRR
jgi:alpha-L-fucosidase